MAVEQHTNFRDSLPAYALGSLDANEAGELARHLTTCADCRRELSSFEAVADALALLGSEVEPSPEVRRRLLAEAGHSRANGARAAQPNVAQAGSAAARPAPTRPARRLWPALALAALAVVVLGGLLWAARGFLFDGGAIIALNPSDKAPGASGELRFTRGQATLEVVGLPTLPADQQYQLWLVHDGQRDSGAVFSVNANGWAEVPVSVSSPVEAYSRFGITVEPAGGSPGPTGDGVLSSAN